MKPCEECGKMIRKKESVLTYLYVCSNLCKQIRKSKMPKKKTLTTLDYWVEQGLTLEQAKAKVSDIQKKRSKRCVEYWTQRGLSEVQAKNQVRAHQSSNGKINAQKYSREERQARSPFSKYYWFAKGFSEKE
jgi:hypothetical protein